MRKFINEISLLICFLFISTSPTIAEMINGDRGMKIGEGTVIQDKAPKGLEVLATKLSSHVGMPKNKSSHGTIDYCYQTDIYVVYSSNPLGYGYQLSRNIPKGLKCLKTDKAIKSRNQLNISIGMSKSEVEKRLNIDKLENNPTIIWQSEAIVKGMKFTLQTYVEMQFKEEKLEWILVFTTETR
jgi:hypothetical protein